MRISVQVHGSLRAISSAGPEARELFPNHGCTVRELLDDLNLWEPDVKQVKRNGANARLDSKLKSQDRVEFY